ncbi:DUF3047 domain-containing protein [Sinimarinibacterium sp. CAU 1509]|uniref:DUF3047 domain-containing protein n=1 Tax=Sinimarinibacterium sp. CAU 1509 TaxID=2562283 RepID=UPI0010ABF8A4|nr:DUF3047 domain-containing protein [Sinimarinibacterium sp. CAU 1509]TJY59344.1 DUF3047 domain-containing protein [Sinimarinibacterium sp. CAU 1509]
MSTRSAVFGLLLSLATAGDAGRVDDWVPQSFDGKAPTRYAVEGEGDALVIDAHCQASASGLVRRVGVDLRATPRLRWRWRTDRVYVARDERSRAGDDFPLRVYVIRDGGWAWWRTRSVVYVWSASERVGAHWPNPYTDHAHIFVAHSGSADVGRWVEQTRDVRADFRIAFGEDLDHADALAVMTDCDDVPGSAEAGYAAFAWLPHVPAAASSP